MRKTAKGRGQKNHHGVQKKKTLGVFGLRGWIHELFLLQSTLARSPGWGRGCWSNVEKLPNS